jgi:GNAT superfamily N-acetyltransferase
MHRSPLHIRPAVAGDLPTLMALYQHLAEGDETPPINVAEQIFDQFHAFPGCAIFVAEIGDMMVASCTLVVIPNLTRGGMSYGLLENVVTHRNFRNQGAGKDLLRYACEAAWAANCYKVMLMTGSKKPETLGFYISAGFEQSKIGFQMRRIPPRAET